MPLQSTELLTFPKKIRSKLRVSIHLSRLLHMIYIALKNFPEKTMQYNSFEELISDLKFLEEAFNKEQARAGRTVSFEDIFLRYYRTYERFVKKGYNSLLGMINAVWALMKEMKKSPYMLLRRLLGLNDSYIEDRLMKVHFTYNPGRMCYEVSNTSLTVLECRFGSRAESLAHLSLYLGELKRSRTILGKTVRLGLASGISLRNQDAHAVVSVQRKGHAHMISTPIRFYPFLLRMQRTSYRKLAVEKDKLQMELLKILNENWIDEEKFGRMLSGEETANILKMIPSASLSGGLCFLAAVEVRMKKPLTERTTASIDEFHNISLYRSPYSLFRVDHRPGDYVVLALIPFSVPDLLIVLGSGRGDEIKITPSQRQVPERFAHYFPKLKIGAK